MDDHAAANSAAAPAVNPWSIPFEMAPLPQAALALVNPRLPCEDGQQGLLRRFAWSVPAQGMEGTPAPRVFHADRYGGHGLGRNGGGARCAADGAWQLKGIGLSPLAGIDNDGRMERPGTATLAECLVEALWSEIFHHALPYGSTRVCTVLATGVPGAPQARPVDRVLGLSVREAAWRPAHFMRAVYFRPAPAVANRIPSDTERVRQAVAQLHRILPMPAASTAAALAAMAPLERLQLGLGEMVRRFAEQIAACNVKRLMHGTLTSSNICLDGRWIDFSTASALPGYAARVKCLAPVLEEYKALVLPLADLCFYIRKYFPTGPGEERARLPQAAALHAAYFEHYEGALARRFCGLCGYPGEMALALWRDPLRQRPMRELARLLLQLGTSGRSTRYGLKCYPDLHERLGDYDLLALIALLPPCPQDAAQADRLAALLPDARLRHSLCELHAQVFEGVRAHALEQGVAPAALARLARLHRARSARTHPLFQRDAMNQHVEALVMDHPDPAHLRPRAEALLGELADHARLLYEDPPGHTCLLWCSGDDELRYDAAADGWRVRAGRQEWRLPWPALFDDAALPSAVAPLARALRAYWGEDLWTSV